jgi:DNA-binding winged helix-turn-helix (wHTH) protein/TolB-like protein/tetratricopeptide (TPR) repeat protein
MEDQCRPESLGADAENTMSFAGYVLDVRAERLLRGSDPVRLRRKCFQALHLLVENPGKVVTKEELTQQLWPDCVVGEDSLHQCIRELRKTLGDSRQQIIRTVPGRGYALAAEVRSGTPDIPAALVALDASSDTPSGGVLDASTVPYRSPRALVYVSAAGLLTLLISALSLLPRPGSRQNITSLAVLPFAVPGGDPRFAYLGEGLAEGVTGSLSRRRKNRVIAFDSAWRLNREKLDTQHAGRRLSAKAVVVGRIRLPGDRLTISVELVRVADNAQLWGKQYSGSLEDLPALESEIAYDISDQLMDGPTQTGQRVPTRRSPNPDGYVEVLRGRYERRKRTPSSNRAALEHFLRATEIDRGLAEAWAGLADVQLDAFAYSGSLPRESRKMAKEAALRALELDDAIGEAHATLAAFRWMEEFDWSAAENEFRRALELAPYMAVIHHRYSTMLLGMGRLSESLAAASRAQELDPLSPVLHAWKGNVQFVSGNHNEALDEGRKALALDGDFGLARLVLGRSYSQLGQYREGLAELEKARDALEGNWRALGDLGYTYAVAGKSDKARDLLYQMIDRARQAHFPALPIALTYAGLGERDLALDWLRRALEERDTELWLKTDPRLTLLRSDPRFVALFRLMKLP